METVSYRAEIPVTKRYPYTRHQTLPKSFFQVFEDSNRMIYIRASKLATRELVHAK